MSLHYLQDAQLHFSAVQPRLRELRQVSLVASIPDRKFTNMAFKLKAVKTKLRGVDKKRDVKEEIKMLKQYMLTLSLRPVVNVFASFSLACIHLFSVKAKCVGLISKVVRA